MIKAIITTLFMVTFFSDAWASKVSIKLNDPTFSDTPADDLTYNGSQISKYDALNLKKSGIDLSNLDPKLSRLWTGIKHSAENHAELNYPDHKTLFKFEEYKSSPSEIFRSVVSVDGERYVLTATLDNHTNILRAAILRLLGYDVDAPKFYKTLDLSFKSSENKTKFLELLGEQTLTKRDRWKSSDIDDNTLRLKGVTLEPAKLRNVNIYLPVMYRQKQESRRVFRALLNLYLITDFPQGLNSTPWAVGREFNNTLIFNHPYAADFSSVTIDDMRWSQKQLNKLSRKDFSEAIATTGLPTDLQALFLEKILSRTNHLSKLLRLESKYSPNKEITIGNIQNGKIVKDAYEDYVVEFYQEDELSPYRFEQLFRLFKTQTMYASLSSLLDKAVEKLLPGKRITDAMEDIQNKIATHREDAQGASPIKAFSSPLASGRVFANRNVIFGQFMGTNAPITLVDSVGAEANLGAFSNITGILEKSLPSASATVSIGRTYTHARAMPDLDAATSQSVKKLFIPTHFKSLGRVIKDEYECGIPSEAYSEEAELRGEKLIYIKYDPSWTDAKDQAIKKRQELIDSGTEETILLVQINREELCVEEIAKTRKDHLQKFLEQFALNEMFIISDTVRLNARINVPIPTSTIPLANMNATIGNDSSLALLRSTMIRKTDQGLEVTLQVQKDGNNTFSQGLNYYIELLSNSDSWSKGKLDSKVYLIDLESLDEQKTEEALRTLRAIFVGSDFSQMKENFAPVELDHSISTKLDTFKFLYFKSEKLNMVHEVEVLAPNPVGENFSSEQRTKKLFAALDYRRKGDDFFSFFNRILSTTTGFLELGSGNNDPGKTFYGNSQKLNVTTEIDLDSKSFAPIAKIEKIYSGWNTSIPKLKENFKNLESDFEGLHSGVMIDHSILEGASQVKSYEARSSIIVYPEGIKRLVELIHDTDELKTIQKLRVMYGERKWDRYCQRANRFFGEDGPQNYRGVELRIQCVPSIVERILKTKRLVPAMDNKEDAKRMNKLLSDFFNSFSIKHVLQVIGVENFFATARVTGLRENHPKGVMEYISNSVGTYNLTHGTGVFDKVAAKLGISAFELKAMMYTPGM
ncbi:MAG: hypothetical protein KC478_08740 [Bacteriovoracaceae bacterium]|nr:hypothetical protein [Bacteriovoracaceae bacterium]